jgi:threonine dehydrogenase-like Zn-dependent dehydrogenase
VSLVRRAGTVSVAGVFVEDRLELPYGDVWLKNVRLTGGLCNVLAHWEEVMALIEGRRIEPTVVISHTLSLEQAKEAYALFDSREALKVVLKP